ncbi:multiple sugar transport system substrate-binding protein [Alkalibacterium putridalgicola]|uniref:Multiple sugar transport system substrate-binding protein n=1 Tax=Alkalibacterium putridalgicola TaxID=426703 RepID=A0A1H7QK22_9LACT|nr:sugar ABC transporter substrate-binding protein [Alkalibacterium putridalgicola]GEK88460.1 sugar ABC transporter substrate-binding protein [Alkalibacterium putridalgicola]SEL47617.1 multiple sugar transport system substrate-binding protein [Alkalibacterium putridalgicola]
MNSKFSKLLKGSAMLATLSLLGACGSDDADTGENSEGTEGSVDELSVWIMGDGNEQAQGIFDAYTEETGIDINLQSIPWSSAHDRLLTAVASGEGPDVVQMGSSYMAEFTDAGALADLTEYVESNDALSADKFYEGNINTTEIDGSYYGIPWYTETRALYYRTDLLEEVGYPEGPSTWEELYDASMQLSERGEDMYGFDINFQEQTFGFMFARQNGSELITEDGEAVLNEPEFVEAIEYLKQFTDNGASPSQDLGLELSQTFGGDGVVPMFISGPWSMTNINNETTDIEGKWSVRTLPEGPENNMSNTGGANLSVWSSSENVEEAVDLIEHMTSTESLLTYYENTSSLPARMETWEEEPFQDELIQVFGEQLESSEHMPVIEEWASISQSYLSTFESIMIGGADTQEALDNFNAEVQSMLD